MVVAGLAVVALAWGSNAGAYARVALEIARLPQGLRQGAWVRLWDDSLGRRGILARVTEQGVWVWRERMLEFIPTNRETIYSYWQACGGQGELTEAEERGIGRWVGTEAGEWAKLARAGQVVTAHWEHEGDDKYAKEIHGYDWRMYLPVSLGEQCAK